MADAKKYNAPVTNPETAPFWEAAKADTFMIKRCTACGQPHYFPRSDRWRAAAVLHGGLTRAACRHGSGPATWPNQATTLSRRNSAMLAAERPISCKTSSVCCPSAGGGKPGLRSSPRKVTG